MMMRLNIVASFIFLCLFSAQSFAYSNARFVIQARAYKEIKIVVNEEFRYEPIRYISRPSVKVETTCFWTINGQNFNVKNCNQRRLGESFQGQEWVVDLKTRGLSFGAAETKYVQRLHQCDTRLKSFLINPDFFKDPDLDESLGFKKGSIKNSRVEATMTLDQRLQAPQFMILDFTMDIDLYLDDPQAMISELERAPKRL